MEFCFNWFGKIQKKIKAKDKVEEKEEKLK